MAEQIPQGHANNSNVVLAEEDKERGCFHFMTNKEEKIEDVAMTDAAKDSKEEKHSLMDELQRTHSHSSSSSDEEVEEGGERKQKKRKKKKKGLKEAIKEKISGEKVGEDTVPKLETCVPTEKCGEEENAELTVHPEEKKSFLEKIKEKLPGQHKKSEEDAHQTPPACEHSSPAGSETTKEKKGIIEKIKEKLPGGHHKDNENELKN